MYKIGKENAQLKLFEAIFPEKKTEIRTAVVNKRKSHNRKFNMQRLKEIFANNQKNGRCVSRRNLEAFEITDLIPRLEKIGRKVM